MPAYLMTLCTITDVTDDFRTYVARAAELVAAHGGEYLIRGKPTAVHEGGTLGDKQVILIRFPSPAALDGFYSSDGYRAAARLREGTGIYETAAWEVP